MQGEMKVLTFVNKMNRTVMPGEIASMLEMTAARITGVLRSLEKKGYIIRRIDENDRRRVLVDITENGRKCVASGTKCLMDRLSEIHKVMGEKDTQALIMSLDRFIEAADVIDSDKERSR